VTNVVELKQLYELQEIDLRVDTVAKSLQDVRSKLAADGPAATARERVSSLETRLEELAALRRRSERSIAELTTKLEQETERLYSGAITSTKEMQAAQEERDFTEQQVTDAEDKLLELMVAIEEAEETLEKGRSVVARLEAQQREQNSELVDTERALSDELRELKPRRDAITDLIDSRLMYQYESLRKSKGGQAVARVEREMCQGCRLSLTSSELQRVRNSTEVIQCDSCRRILYYP